MRRIVTGNVDGRSTIVIDDEIKGSWAAEIWAATPDEPLGFERSPEDQENTVEPVPSGSVIRMVTLPPHREIVASIRTYIEDAAERGEKLELDENGFHATNSLDYNIILDGPVELVLDDKSVTVQPGEVVVQRQTNHAWQNHGDAPIRILNIMMALPAGHSGAQHG